jgi:hypothetical protein
MGKTAKEITWDEALERVKEMEDEGMEDYDLIDGG